MNDNKYKLSNETVDVKSNSIGKMICQFGMLAILCVLSFLVAKFIVNIGIDEKPITIFKGLTTSAGKNFYPQDLSIEEFHEILLNMFKQGNISEIKKILSSRTMVRRENDILKAIDTQNILQKNFQKWQTN